MRLLFILFLFLSFNCFSQDTLSVYFKFGSSRVQKWSVNSLNDLQDNPNLLATDSIQFIGYADSIGNLNSNIKLSKKRANNVFKFVKHVLPEDIPTSILAKGEAQKINLSENRRVDIILHYAIIKELPIDEITPEELEEKCIFFDHVAEKYYHTTTITKRKRTYIRIEAMPIDRFTKGKHYYALTNRDGSKTYRRIKWKKTTTGKLWWRKQRLVALVPKESYESFHIFTISEPPCNNCTEKILSNDTIYTTDPFAYIDVFLMTNSQIKRSFFRRKIYKIRVPKEYVNSIQTYYSYTYKYSFKQGNKSYFIDWKTKKQKKNKPYLYTKIKTSDSLMYIYKIKRIPICVTGYYQPDYSYLGFGTPKKLEGCSLPLLSGNIELGSFYHNDTLWNYLGPKFRLNFKKFQFSLLTAINTKKRFYGELNFNYTLKRFYFGSRSIINSWKSATLLKKQSKYFSELKVGTTLKTFYSPNYQNFTETNLHLRLDFQKFPNLKYLPSFYLQSGFSTDFSNKVNSKIYPFVQGGIYFRIFKIN